MLVRCPAFAQRVTVFGSTLNFAATSAGVISVSSLMMCLSCGLCPAAKMAAGRGLLVVALDAGGDALAVVADLVRPEGAEPSEQHQDGERDEQVAEAPAVVEIGRAH